MTAFFTIDISTGPSKFVEMSFSRNLAIRTQRLRSISNDLRIRLDQEEAGKRNQATTSCFVFSGLCRIGMDFRSEVIRTWLIGLEFKNLCFWLLLDNLFMDNRLNKSQHRKKSKVEVVQRPESYDVSEMYSATTLPGSMLGWCGITVYVFVFLGMWFFSLEYRGNI